MRARGLENAEQDTCGVGHDGPAFIASLANVGRLRAEFPSPGHRLRVIVGSKVQVDHAAIRGVSGWLDEQAGPLTNE